MRYLFALILTLTTSTTLAQDNIRTAIFAGGCFWCMEPPYDKLEGVLETTSGYSGGHVKNPSYDQVSAGNTGHAEVVRVKYDADKIGYEELLQVFWRNVDPLDAGGQFCDRGSQYRSAIFYGNEEEKKLAEASKAKVAKKLDGKIATEIVAASKFYPAEKYHQNYYQRNPIRYKYYRFRCGRDQRLEEVWGG
ncbi:peptide-methionine (S)-S-oxide reductase MsrA [Microbulbifer rhizosphaerae]|uniref:Peptide methionine sulfoxide reductase MsrA n=1 Tax=Microbulbifer rhizosphaerae TaxID=1562603 RepID=A0A7W4W8B9_9GAMM|nr:peptide-methionine (S)-S-oxide reductase MsrA [Microbulbifer rhizosphaerae]MBB3059582.1 peptide-methionine (S)-S-oxide reductase [Microbulbifer rhizosphaerae]